MSTVLLVTFQIDKVTPGTYRAVVVHGATEIAKPGHYASIEEAILGEIAALPDDFVGFADVTYGGVSSGTMSIIELRNQAPQTAARLVAIIAEMHLLSGQ